MSSDVQNILRHSPETSAELLSQMETSWRRKQKGVSQQIWLNNEDLYNSNKRIQEANLPIQRPPNIL